MQSTLRLCKSSEEIQRIAAAAEAEELRQAIERNRELCRIPARFASASFDGYETEDIGQTRALRTARAFAERFAAVLERGSSMTFCGAPGTGKTHLACAIANALLADGRSVIYRTAYCLLREIKATWGGAIESESEVMRRFSAADLLIVDEVGVQFGTESEKVLTFDVLNTRYAEMRPTLVVSNLDEAGLAEYLGERIYDRLADSASAVIPFTWQSYRRKRQ